MRPLTQTEFVNKATERAKRPVDLSRFTYSGCAVKSTAICPDHGEFQITPNALMNRIGCPACALIERAAKRRMDHTTFIEKSIAVHGDTYEYGRANYSGSLKDVTITCKVHGDFNQKATVHLRGSGCPLCGNEQVGKKLALSQAEFIAEAVKAHGTRYDLSEVVYTCRTKKVKVICKDHGAFFPLAGNFAYLGTGCKKCGNASVGLISRRSRDSYVKEALVVHSGRFSYGDVEYINNAAYMTVVCKEHGEFKQLARDHLNGVGCTKCSKPIFDRDSFIRAASSVHGDRYGYAKVNYTGATDKVEIVCPEHGSFMQGPTYHVNMGNGCPRCANTGPSSGQIEVSEFLRQYTAVEEEVVIGTTRRRLDMHLPEYHLAVEYHGLIWHSTAFSSDPLKDFKKHREAEANGIRVLHIYQDEWEFRNDIVKRTLLSAIGKLPRMFARNTEVMLVDPKIASAFYKQNHLQGSLSAACSIGLYKDEEMVACMSFSMAKSIRGNSDKGLWELQRYASKLTVVGGASRLLHAFLQLVQCHTLISYSDTRLFTGQMYEALGFTLEHETEPDYCYVTTNTSVGRIHKSKFQRKFLETKLKTFDPDKSEVQNCFENGFYQLFDCGKKKWVLAC